MNTHIGRAIKKVLESQGRSKTWLAEKLCQDRTNIYKILRKDNIDIQLLMKISICLDYNFFSDLSSELALEAKEYKQAK